MRTGLIALCLLMVSSMAKGQEEPPLAGPQVVEERRDDDIQERHFVPTDRERAARERLRARMLPGLLRELGGRRAPSDLRLSEAQRERIEALQRAFHEELDAHIQNRKAEIVEILRTLGMHEEAAWVDELERGDGARVTELLARAPRAIMTRLAGEDRTRAVERGVVDRQALFRSLSDEQQGALRRLVEIQRELPTNARLNDAVLDVLDDAQRRFVEQRVDQAMSRARQEERRRARRDEMDTERPAEAMGKMDAMAGDTVESPALHDRRGPDRLDRLLERLTPEQRELLADFIERRLLQADRKRRKPPPSMDEVVIPPPSDG